MRILRLKIGKPFRSLPAGFELLFSNIAEIDVETEPICLVGANGSGKSNVLEALAEIFEYLDLYFLKYIGSLDPTIDKFIVEYLLPIEYTTIGLFTEPVYINGMEYGHIQVEKLPDQAPSFAEFVEGELRPIEARSELLPSRILAYSSGQNELLSIPFNKINFKYYHSLRQEQKLENYRSYVGTPRLRYFGYEDSPLILLSNYLMQNEDELDVINSKLGIENIYSFELFINPYFRKKNSIQATIDLQRVIDFLKGSATRVISSALDAVRLEFIVNKELILKFKGQFPDGSSLFNALSWLSLLNMNGIPIKQMSRLLSATDNAYIEYRPADFEPNFKFFTIGNIHIKKVNLELPINYRTLSDGEHQFMFIVGVLNLFKADTSLFLFDEPETHFNPKWKYECIDEFKKVSSKIRSQIVLTTHDPVLLSGLKKNNVIIFNKPNSNLTRTYRPIKDIKGMGVDAILMSEIFGFDTAVDFNTKLELIEFRELSIKRLKQPLSREETIRYEALYENLRGIDFAEPLDDPIYREYLSLFENFDLYKKAFLTPEELVERRRIASEILIQMQEKLKS